MYAVEQHVATLVFPIRNEKGLAVVIQMDEFQADTFLEVIQAMRLLRETAISDVSYPVHRDAYFIRNCRKKYAYMLNTKPKKHIPIDIACPYVHYDGAEVYVTCFPYKDRCVSQSFEIEELYNTINKRMAKRESFLF